MTERFRFALLLALAAAPTAAGLAPAMAAITNDTIQISNVVTQPPALAIDPDGTLHVAIKTGNSPATSLVHAWRGNGPWQFEPIATFSAANTLPIGWAAGNSGRTAVAYHAGGGPFIVARHELSGWVRDTLATSGVGNWFSLAVDPVTDAAVVAYGFQGAIRIARRGPTGWKVSTVDSGVTHGTLSLALDSAGRPRLAILGGPNGEGGLFFAEADTDEGPWTWAPVDTSSAYYVYRPSLALDPVTGEPRIAHGSSPGFERWSIRYASRAAGVWTPEEITPWTGSTVPTPGPSLSIDESGRARIVQHAELMQGVSQSITPCGYKKMMVMVLERASAATPGPFQATILSTELGGHAGVLASVARDHRLHAVWRDQSDASCLPSALIHTVVAIPTGVPPYSAHRSTLSLQPNPIRPGGTLQLRLHAADGTVAFDLTDIAGRRVASTRHVGAGGEREIRWSLPTMRAGWYRVTARQGGVTLGSASFLVIR